MIAQLVVLGSDYTRRCLLAPPKDPIWNLDGKHYYQSFAAWKKSELTRKLLWLLFSLTSVPIHILYNSILITSVPAYDAYEVLVNEKFFQGQPANVLTLEARQYENQPGAPVRYAASWPDQWPGSSRLQHSLEQVQRDPSLWTNLSNYDCRLRYGLEIYQKFRTVIIVTDWHSNPSSNNSALAVGALPGFPPNGVPNRFMPLCPQFDNSIGYTEISFMNTDDAP